MPKIPGFVYVKEGNLTTFYFCSNFIRTCKDLDKGKFDPRKPAIIDTNSDGVAEKNTANLFPKLRVNPQFLQGEYNTAQYDFRLLQDSYEAGTADGSIRPNAVPVKKTLSDSRFATIVSNLPGSWLGAALTEPGELPVLFIQSNE